MDAMKKAIMKRRMALAGDMEEMKDADMNPAEGSEDDLNIAKKKAEMGDDGLAPDLAENDGEGGEMEIELEMKAPAEEGGDRASMLEGLLAEDDVGKPGIKGKAAAKIMEALKKLKV